MAEITIKLNPQSFSRYFKAFGDPTRLKIIMLLSDGELNVNEIVKEISLSQPTVSRHLAILRQANIVTDRREAQQVFYRLNKESIESCCSGFCCCLEIPAKSLKKPKKS